jgi:enamine deaminase RidA (YjgF/YER057c/UK114 family)
VVDAYRGENDVVRVEGRTRLGCHAHARSSFFDAKDGAPEASFKGLDCRCTASRPTRAQAASSAAAERRGQYFEFDFAPVTMAMLADAPMRFAPAVIIFIASSVERTPPEAFTPTSSPTMRRISATSSAVAPPLAKPVAVYVPAVISGHHVFTSGQLPFVDGALPATGKVGAEVAAEDAARYAGQCALNALAAVQSVIGSLDRIKRVVKLLGLVNSAPDFYDHPKVINGCSELFAEIWGAENGIGARSAVGMGPLPGNIAVEIEVIFELA